MNLKEAKLKNRNRKNAKDKTIKFLQGKPQLASDLVADKTVFDALIKKASRPLR